MSATGAQSKFSVCPICEPDVRSQPRSERLNISCPKHGIFLISETVVRSLQEKKSVEWEAALRMANLRTPIGDVPIVLLYDFPLPKKLQ